MITLASIKNFFKKYRVYVLLWIAGLGGVYYLTADNQSATVNQNKTLKKEGQTKKRKTKKNILDPVIDNIYWSIASFIVYYLIYLGLRYLGYKDHAFWVIPALIVLGKLGLITFSSFYYQKNNFDQNLEKSFHPVYFIHQRIEQIILSLIGYSALAVLIYRDYKGLNESNMVPGQESNQNNTMNNNLNNNQNNETEKSINQNQDEKENEIIDIINELNNQTKENNNQNQNVHETNNIHSEMSLNIENSKNDENLFNNQNQNIFSDLSLSSIDSIKPSLENKTKKNFEKSCAAFSNNYLLKYLENKGIFNFKQFVASISQSIMNKKIDQKGLEKIIHEGPIYFFMHREKRKNYYFVIKIAEKRRMPILECFFSSLHYFFSKENNDDKLKEMVDIHLNKIIANPCIEEINSSFLLINEFFYFANCIRNLYDNFFVKKNNHDSSFEKSGYEDVFYVNISNFKNVHQIKNFHLNFLKKLTIKFENDEDFIAIKNRHFEKEKNNITNDEEYKAFLIEEYHFFLRLRKVKESINITPEDFSRMLQETSDQTF